MKTIQKPLTQMVRHCGCGAKLGPGTLASILQDIKADCSNDALLIGPENSDDAAAYQLPGGEILLQTLDFFPPMIDDPYIFGQIAAANALSDIYAMGGRPLTAMNIVAYPQNGDMSVLGSILKGGRDKVKEAGAVIAGGHSVDDLEPKYGLSVTGITDSEHLRGNNGGQPGDVLILTKALGTGIILSAHRGGIVSDSAINEAITSMTTLNKDSCEIAAAYDVHSITDITGFGLAGHLVEMADASEVTAIIDFNVLPIMENTLKWAEMGIVPEGTYRNRAYFGDKCQITGKDIVSDLVFDPQTSGGLLLSVASEEAESLLETLNTSLSTPAAIIGKLVPQRDNHLYVEG